MNASPTSMEDVPCQPAGEQTRHLDDSQQLGGVDAASLPMCGGGSAGDDDSASPGESASGKRAPADDAVVSHSRSSGLEEAMQEALHSGCYLIGIWRVSDRRVHFYRELLSFPEGDFPIAERLLHEDLARLSTQLPQ